MNRFNILKSNIQRENELTRKNLEKIHKFKDIDKENHEEIEKAIKYIMNEINENYNYEKFLNKAGNTKNMSDKLYKSLKGSGINGVSVDNLEKNYLYYKCGKYDAYEFMCDIEDLLDFLICELSTLEEWLMTGKIENKEGNYYERA